ncbi:hypothetical protein T12_9676, partial [Trichinella patagoniensis]
LQGYDHPPAACRRRSTFADREGCPLYPEFWPSRCRWCLSFQPPA